jgi:hypothetical protein
MGIFGTPLVAFWLFAVPFYVTHVSSKRETSSRSGNLLITDSWNHFQYHLVASQSGAKNGCVAIILSIVLRAVLLCLLRLLTFWRANGHKDFWDLFPFDHQCQPIYHHWNLMFSYLFFPALNVSFRIHQLFCVLSFYMELLMQDFSFVKISATCFFGAYFAEVCVQLNAFHNYS